MTIIDETKKPLLSESTNIADPTEVTQQKRNIYKVKHISWRIRTALPYPSTEPLLKIISELGSDFQEAFKTEDADFLGFATKLFQTGKLPRIFALVLEPANTNPIRSLLNKFWMKHYKIDSRNVIEYMTDDDWRPIVADFFIIGSQWIGSWLHTTGLFGSTNSEKSSNSFEQSLMKTILNSSTISTQQTSKDSMPVMENIASSERSAGAPN